MSAIRSFRAFGNELEGQLPADVATLTGLKDFSIQRNNLVGEVPGALCTELQADGATALADCSEITCTCCTCCDDTVVSQVCSGN